ncbi:MAG: DUF5105 domain-containing protein [Firmicutes bacterium]|nr:DUF5105 domain-containing protein [Bacillota bacterium]
MSGIINTILSILLAAAISGGASAMAEVEPQEAADGFFRDLASGNDQVAMAYMDNKYVNFLENVKSTDEEMDNLEEAVFRNFSYEITDSASKNDVAVVKVTVRNSDFSGVMEDYKKESYEYVTENLYSDDVVSKEKLNKKCIDIYLDQVEKTAESDANYEAEIFLPMEEDGYGGWRILLSDEIMKEVLGKLEIPTNE